MNPLVQALREVGKALVLAVSGTAAMMVAIWSPTLALQHWFGWRPLEAYLFGCPLGLSVLVLIGIGVMRYRLEMQRARR